MFKFLSNSGQKCSPEPEFRSIYEGNHNHSITCGLRDNLVSKKPVKKCGKLPDVQGRRTKRGNSYKL